MDGYAPADVATIDRGSDVALLRVNPSLLRHAETAKWQGCGAPANGAPLYALGIRADSEPRLFELAIVRGVPIDRIERVRELLDGPKRTAEPWITISQQISPGYSGGAIIDANACLVGMLVGAPEVAGRWTEFSYGIRTVAIDKLLQTVIGKQLGDVKQ